MEALGVRHVDGRSHCRAAAGFVRMRRDMDRVRVLPAHLHDIELRRPGTIRRQQPESRPDAVIVRHVGAHLEIAVGLGEGFVGRQQARCVFVIVDMGPDCVRRPRGCDGQHSVIDAERIDGACRGVVVVDVPLLFTVPGKRAAVFPAPPEIRVPGAARAVPQAERVELIRKGQGEFGSVEAEIELACRELADIRVCKYQFLVAVRGQAARRRRTGPCWP